MRVRKAKNISGVRNVLDLNIAGVKSRIIIGPEYTADFVKILKVRYRDFTEKETAAKKCFVYKGLANKYAFENFVRRLYSSLLLKNNGFLLHASGVISKGRGYIFTGVSGAGKTTAAKASKRNGLILSDEIVALRKTGNSWTLFGTPFMGLMKGGGKNRAIKAPKLLFLKQAQKNALKPVSKEKAWGKFLRNIVLFKPEKKIAGLSFDFINSVESRVLEFRKKGFWRILWAII